MKSKRRNKKQIFQFLITGIIVFFAFITASFFPQNDLLLFFVFMSLIPIFAALKLDGRVPISYAIALLALAACIRDIGYQLSVFSYWLLFDGVSCLIIDLLRRKSDNDK